MVVVVFFFFSSFSFSKQFRFQSTSKFICGQWTTVTSATEKREEKRTGRRYRIEKERGENECVYSRFDALSPVTSEHVLSLSLSLYLVSENEKVKNKKKRKKKEEEFQSIINKIIVHRWKRLIGHIDKFNARFFYRCACSFHRVLRSFNVKVSFRFLRIFLFRWSLLGIASNSSFWYSQISSIDHLRSAKCARPRHIIKG